MSEKLRGFADGVPTPEMVEYRDDALARIDPASRGRWPETDIGRFALALAAFESGWDWAISQQRAMEKEDER